MNLLSPLDDPTIPGLDPGIEAAVVLLRRHGIATYESCEGGAGHSSPEPFVKFGGSLAEAMYAMSIVLFSPSHGLRPFRLSQVWGLHDGFPDGPRWEITFYPLAGPHSWTWPGREVA